jgi:hypothetical protein
MSASVACASGYHAEMTLIAYFGLISRSKGIDTLVQALTHLPEYVSLLVIGGEATAPHDRAFAAEVLKQIAAARLEGRVH